MRSLKSRDYYKFLKEKIVSKRAQIGVMGLGYVGLPLALEFARRGYLVFGYETNPRRINFLKKGIRYITDVEPFLALRLIKEGRFILSEREEVLAQSEVILICVPTPLRKVKIPDISYIVKAAETIRKFLVPPKLIVLESTTYPGTSREVILSLLKKTGLKEERDFFLSFSPERIDPANKKYPLRKIPKVVGGIGKKSTELTRLLYSQIIKEVVSVSSLETAEMVKLLENTFRLINIALVNECAILCKKLGVSIWEVIEAAKTKPFGFMPFYPGPGVGGHCIGEHEFIFVKNGNGIEVTTIASFVEKIKEVSTSRRHILNGIEYLRPKGYKILSFDVEKKRAIFSPINILSKRKTDEKLFRIITNDNRKIDVTSMHPMFILSGGKLKIKFARDLKIGDELPFILKADYEKVSFNNKALRFDLIEFLKGKPDLIKRIRVKPKNFSWRQYKKQIYKLRFDNGYYHDYIRYNSLPLKYFLKAEEKKFLKVGHEELLLVSGRGPSYSELPATIKIDHNFCRLVGYYLSEGCLTRDKSLRIRFSFNVDEKEYIGDVCNILGQLGIKYSTYQSKRWNSFCIKISSNLLGFLISEVLKCGSNSYQMRIPSLFFILPQSFKIELLKGILRGDGGIDVRIGKFSYIKKSKHYCHFRNSAGVNYFSCNRVLLQQVIFLLQELGIVPIFKKRDGLFYIFGHKQLSKLEDIFLGKKRLRIERYLKESRKIIPNRSFKKYETFGTSKIKKIERVDSKYVYSAEVENVNTIVTSYGTIVHNCIPADPMYLSWKAKKLGFKTKMIDLASYINHFMPRYVIERVKELLKNNQKDIKKAKILILGVTYKKDVKDLRESPSLDIIEILEAQKIKVDYFDPFIPYLNIKNINLKSISLTKTNIRKYDCVLLITDHTKVDYKFIQKNAKLIFDTRNVYKKDFDNVERL